MKTPHDGCTGPNVPGLIDPSSASALIQVWMSLVETERIGELGDLRRGASLLT
jgi:hypothetical protein